MRGGAARLPRSLRGTIKAVHVLRRFANLASGFSRWHRSEALFIR